MAILTWIITPALNTYKYRYRRCVKLFNFNIFLIFFNTYYCNISNIVKKMCFKIKAWEQLDLFSPFENENTLPNLQSMVLSVKSGSIQKKKKSPMRTGFGSRRSLNAAHVSHPPLLMGDLPPGHHGQMLCQIKAGLYNWSKKKTKQTKINRLFFFVFISVLLTSRSKKK